VEFRNGSDLLLSSGNPLAGTFKDVGDLGLVANIGERSPETGKKFAENALDVLAQGLAVYVRKKNVAIEVHHDTQICRRTG
jgi:hypothetical protein